MTKQPKKSVWHQAPTPADLRDLALWFLERGEAQKAQLAQELHSDFIQKLTALSLDIALLQGHLGRHGQVSARLLRERFKEMRTIVGEMIQTVRQIKSDLRPKILDELGLVAALQWETKRFADKTGVTCQLSHPPVEDVTMREAVRTQVFRIIQEILRLIEMHAKAKAVEIDLQARPGELRLQVRDNGRSWAASPTRQSTVLGLLEIEERSRSIDAGIEIESSGRQGTTIGIRVPLARCQRRVKGRQKRKPVV